MSGEGNLNIEWESKKSGNGADYEVGRLPSSGGGAKSADGKSGDFKINKQAFDWPGHWPVGPDEWKNAEYAFRMDTGIQRYKVHKSSHPLYDYVIEIDTWSAYDYRFIDETGDEYKLDVWNSGEHLVRYNSKKPTITHVKGS